MSSLGYISTRGSAPKLGFEDVLLAGLARDGGLYVPEIWPCLSRDEIAAFAGMPFSQVAVAILDLFAGGAISRQDLSRMADEAYATFGHAAVTPLVQLDPETFVLELGSIDDEMQLRIRERVSDFERLQRLVPKIA